MEELTVRAKLDYVSHVFKAVAQQHHKDMVPVLSPFIPRDAIVIDVGAHAGQFTKLFAKLARDGHVFAFEQGRYALSILRTVCKMHTLSNVTVLPYGLSDAEAMSELHVPIKRSGIVGFGLSHMGKADAKSRSESVSLTTLDAFVAAHAVKRIDFIKADIEGWELRMLSAARTSLRVFRPVLFLEACDEFLLRAGDSLDSLQTFLREMDYKIYTCHQGETVEKATIANGDILCIPAAA